ncbi:MULTISPECIES: phosphodiesterase [Dethiosulfovibrio]|jgi:hypothetical protein|uniref:Phosphoesterase n=2 Tax=Dethiosulfovibrio TaxID=47054 RepID=A0ABS9EQL9_9BACT|nr:MULTISPECIES: phosphodiesterase [Dethiosulfovibrio]MCF4114791.1 phosphodiesterase [Dethiosulfovibrio russensis]MCF4143004.1 phosphodiesterase [Dethiosulfovibrio marinus]MCF4145296.1 phosphodiesterase [Dethiosulfovibrio acidaminovorans]MEA3284471.1 phosphodiesterase [Synergistota bacterium]
MAKIGIISDTHGDLHSWQKASSLWGKVELVLHCGDILTHPETLASRHLAEEMSLSQVPVMISRGNCDRDCDQNLLAWPISSPYVSLFWKDRFILMGHGHRFSELRDLSRRCRPSMVVTGHTHVASLVREDGIVYLNPGSASAPRGRDPASFAIVSEDDIEIVTLEGLQLYRERW